MPRKNVAMEGPKVAVIFWLSGSEGLPGSGNPAHYTFREAPNTHNRLGSIYTTRFET
jgi:hypothetical protein